MKEHREQAGPGSEEGGEQAIPGSRGAMKEGEEQAWVNLNYELNTYSHCCVGIHIVRHEEGCAKVSQKLFLPFMGKRIGGLGHWPWDRITSLLIYCS